MERIGIGIAGGTGYGAHELLRLLSNHPHCEVVTISSRSEASTPVTHFHRDLHGLYDLSFDAELHIKKLAAFERRFVFTALPHGASISYINLLLETDPAISIIDLSGDLRLRNESVHHAHYPESPFVADLRSQFVYGLTELNHAAIKTARHISNPGCYPTATSLAAAPLIADQRISGPLVVNAASGTSGAGRSLADTLHHPLRHASVKAYKALSHRHEPEIHQALGDPECTKYELMFVPHLLPVTRGIHISLYTTLSTPLSSAEALALYRDFYKDSPFVRVVAEPPELADVIGSNFCNIHITTRGRQAVVFAVEDNLIKGMAGQAIQNMNLMLGLDETAGLLQAPLGIL